MKLQVNNFCFIKKNYFIYTKFYKSYLKFFAGLSLSTSCRGMLVSCSNDGVMKVWDLADQTAPTLVWQQTNHIGAIQCLAANPDSGFVFFAGGDNKENNFKVFDLREIPAGNR